MTESILVVGATGTVGSELVSQLAATGRSVRALVRSEEKAAGIADVAEPVIGDLSDPASLAPAFRRIERVFVLAPPVEEMSTLVGNALDVAVAAGAKRIVYLSAFGAGELDGDAHFVAHAANEKRLTSLDVDWTILRPTRFMTHTPFVWSSVLERGLLLEADGDGAMTVFDPADVAAVALAALTTEGHTGQIYKLTSEDLFTTRELADTLSRALGRELTLFQGDAEDLRSALVDCGAPPEFAPIMAGYFATVAAGFWEVTDTAARILGRAPRSYAQWLDHNLPAIVSAAEEA
jgi:uncharacterized protein YbjT (DUF2867 family)